jgi:hypothetical protein
MIRTATLAAVLTASLALAAPALAKPVAYSGKVSGGHEITFVKSGNSLKKLYALVTTTCVPVQQSTYTARAGSEIVAPPGRVPLGREHRVTALQEPVMHYNEVTKNYRVTTRKRARGVITGRLHVNFSYQTVGSDSWGLKLVGFVCQGDATFRARPSG